MTSKCSRDAGNGRSFIRSVIAVLERELEHADGSEAALALLGDVQRALKEIEERTLH